MDDGSSASATGFRSSTASASGRNPSPSPSLNLLPDLNTRLIEGDEFIASELIDTQIIPNPPRAPAGVVVGELMDELPSTSFVRGMDNGDVSLRQWLDKPDRSVDVVECLHIFRQIVEIVNIAHSHGIVVQNVRPSCFVMSSFNHVAFIESASCSDSGSESPEDRMKSQTLEVMGSTATLPHYTPRTRSQSEVEHFQQLDRSANNSLVSESQCTPPSNAHATSGLCRHEKNEHYLNNNNKSNELCEEGKPPFPMKQVLLMEMAWYTSPEEAAGGESSCASDIYRLGVLLFELFCPFSTREEKSMIMSSLRHRLLPPQMLLKWSKEASFCLWLLHPEPTSRPQMCELLQTEFLNEVKDNLAEHEAAIELKEKIEEHELLLEFLLISQQRKEEASDRLQKVISLVSSDIVEVENMHRGLTEKRDFFPRVMKHNFSASNLPSLSNQGSDAIHMSSRKRFRSFQDLSSAECDDNVEINPTPDQNQDTRFPRNSLLMKNFRKLESAYLSTRLRQIKTFERPTARNSVTSSDGKGSVVVNERSSVNNLVQRERYSEDLRKGWVSPFLEGFCRYLSFTKLKVKADLKQGDLLNSSNLVCALSFDRDGDFFATAGVNKKIKIFDCDSIIRGDRDIHYPIVEMVGRSKLSSICWNSYIKSHIASSNFDGIVQLWDFTRSQALMELKEHEKRVWSIDFSSADPTTLASGSDDGSVKLWNINQGVSVGTIKTKANVCCVQFPSDSGRSLVFGSADHKIYYYDLRNMKIPLVTIVGHQKTVSYVKFVDSKTLVSASTDNTLKLWDLSICSSRIIDTPLQSFSGHTNIKNFVGLSVHDGYIATGSETNEVFVYHKAFPMPALSFKFNTTDPLSGQDADDPTQFVSSVCWRGQSSTLVSANSTGNIKILEMV